MSFRTFCSSVARMCTRNTQRKAAIAFAAAALTTGCIANPVGRDKDIPDTGVDGGHISNLPKQDARMEQDAGLQDATPDTGNRKQDAGHAIPDTSVPDAILPDAAVLPQATQKTFSFLIGEQLDTTLENRTYSCQEDSLSPDQLPQSDGIGGLIPVSSRTSWYKVEDLFVPSFTVGCDDQNLTAHEELYIAGDSMWRDSEDAVNVRFNDFMYKVTFDQAPRIEPDGIDSQQCVLRDVQFNGEKWFMVGFGFPETEPLNENHIVRGGSITLIKHIPNGEPNETIRLVDGAEPQIDGQNVDLHDEHKAGFVFWKKDAQGWHLNAFGISSTARSDWLSQGESYSVFAAKPNIKLTYKGFDRDIESPQEMDSFELNVERDGEIGDLALVHPEGERGVLVFNAASLLRATSLNGLFAGHYHEILVLVGPLNPQLEYTLHDSAGNEVLVNNSLDGLVFAREPLTESYVFEGALGNMSNPFSYPTPQVPNALFFIAPVHANSPLANIIMQFDFNAGGHPEMYESLSFNYSLEWESLNRDMGVFEADTIRYVGMAQSLVGCLNDPERSRAINRKLGIGSDGGILFDSMDDHSAQLRVPRNGPLKVVVNVDYTPVVEPEN